MDRKRGLEYKLWLLTQLYVFTCCSVCSSRCLAYDSATEEDFLRLTDTLLTGYNRNVRPIVNQSASMNISLDFNLISINDVDDVRQLISVMATTVVYWCDKNLVWDPAEFGGLAQMYFGPGEIWTPRIYFMKSHDINNALFDYPTHHLVDSNGTVTFSSTAKLTCSCKLDLVLFPSDTQSCQFSFAVFDSSTKDVDLVVDIAASYSTPIAFTENGEWEVLDIEAGHQHKTLNPLGYVTASAIVRLRRRPDVYYLNIYTPIFSIAILCALTFFVPVDSGERLSYALNMHLSLSVYISYVGGIMPRASLGMPNVFYILSALFFSSVLCVAMSALVMALRWCKVTTSSEGTKTVKVLCFKFCLNKNNSPPITTEAPDSESGVKSRPPGTFSKHDFIRPSEKVEPRNKNKIVMIFPTGEIAKQLDLNDDKEHGETNTEEFDLATEQPVQQVASSPGSQANGHVGGSDPDLVRICDVLDYWGFVVVSAFITLVVVMTSLNRRWY